MSKRRRAAGVLIATILTLAAGMPVLAASAPHSSLPQRAVLTGNYLISTSAGEVIVRAGDAGGNHREVGWPTQLASLDGQVCATWASESSPAVQEGLALRITTAGGRTRAITVTKNVVYGITWVINAHVWDSAAAEPFVGVGQWDMGQVLSDWVGGIRPLPWRICARVAGPTLTWKLWVLGVHVEPSWTDPVHTRQTTVPPEWIVVGVNGWYAGHLPSGGSAVYTDLTLAP